MADDFPDDRRFNRPRHSKANIDSLLTAGDVTFDPPISGFIIGVDGTLNVHTAGGEDVNYPAGQFALGSQVVCEIIRIKSASTATKIAVFW